MHLCCQQKDLQEGGDAEAADVASASEALWLELRKAIPDAEEDGMTLRDFRALTQVALGCYSCLLCLLCLCCCCAIEWRAYWSFSFLLWVQVDLEELMQLVRVTKRGKLRRLHAAAK